MSQMNQMIFPNPAYTGEIHYANNKFYLKVANEDGMVYKLQVRGGTTSDIINTASTETNDETLAGFRFYTLPVDIQKDTDPATAITYELLAYADADDPMPLEATGFYYFDNSGSSVPATDTGTGTGTDTGAGAGADTGYMWTPQLVDIVAANEDPAGQVIPAPVGEVPGHYGFYVTFDGPVSDISSWVRVNTEANVGFVQVTPVDEWGAAPMGYQGPQYHSEYYVEVFMDGESAEAGVSISLAQPDAPRAVETYMPVTEGANSWQTPANLDDGGWGGPTYTEGSWLKLTLDADVSAEGPDGAFRVLLGSSDMPAGSDIGTWAWRSTDSARDVFVYVPDNTMPLTGALELSGTGVHSPIGGGLITDAMGHAIFGGDPISTTVGQGDIGNDVREGGSGFDTLDLSGLTTGPLLINAELGIVDVADEHNAIGGIDAFGYEKYILNDRYGDTVDVDGNTVYREGNTFFGTTASEYIVVGQGGDNLLFAGNRDGNSLAPEMDIVDYSQIAADAGGITVRLGDWSAEPGHRGEVTVSYGDDGQSVSSDIISGFEGVVGSQGNDTISGSNGGDFLVGGAGDDVITAFTGGVDLLYTPEGRVSQGIATDGDFLVVSSDWLMGGTGVDTLRGGAGSDMLVDLDQATMYGSEKSGRDSAATEDAEHDVFVVRNGATIENFHLSKDGTGLAGRSSQANDMVVFSVNSSALLGAAAAAAAGDFDAYRDTVTGDVKDGEQSAFYQYVYDNLTFTSQLSNGNDVELIATFKHEGFISQVGSVTIAGLGAQLQPSQGEVADEIQFVNLDWLNQIFQSDMGLGQFNPKFDMESIKQSGGGEEFAYTYAIALELVKAGTVRGPNEYGVLAADLSTAGLDERIYNPGQGDDRMLGSAGNERYEFKLQFFEDAMPIVAPPGSGGAEYYSTGNDAVFDWGGYDVLAFEAASIADLSFEAVRVGRESGQNSLRVTYNQEAVLDDGESLGNSGAVTWQGHFKDGGRQAAEAIKAGDDTFLLAETVYDYNARGYTVGGPKITSRDVDTNDGDWSKLADVIMVGQYQGYGRKFDTFVFETGDADAAVVADATNNQLAVDGGSDNKQVAHFWNADAGDIIDLSSYVAKFGGDGSAAGFELIDSDISDGSWTVGVGFLSDTTDGTTKNAFTLDLVFHSASLDFELATMNSDEIVLIPFVA